MTSWLWAAGTLFAWCGWALALRAVLLASRRWIWGERSSGLAGSGAAALLALGIGYGLTSSVPPDAGVAARETAWRLPLAWPVMPFAGWLALAGLAMAAVRLAQAATALQEPEKTARLRSAGLWAVAGAAGLMLFRADPEAKVRLLVGAVPFGPGRALAFLALASGAVFAMVAAERAARLRGYVKAVSTHLALLAGSVLFGIPLAFLLVTSFKEDRDMVSPHGIVWVPRVQRTVPYDDPNRPLYEGRYRGQEVEGTAVGTMPDGRLQIDIRKPFALRGTLFEASPEELRRVPRQVPLVRVEWGGRTVLGRVVEELEDGSRRVEALEPKEMAGQRRVFPWSAVQPVRQVGLRWQNYPEALSYLPPETQYGLVYLRNTLLLVLLNVSGTLLASALAAYAFSRLSFPGRDALFWVLLSTMMLPGAVTLLPQFLVFRWLGWVDTLYPLWVPAFFGSAFNIFLLRQFFLTIPMELEDAAKIDGCSYWRAFWDVMLPQVKPALAVIAIWTFMGTWNNFMGPLIYINSPENMPLTYALQLYQSARGDEPGLLMAFATMAMLPVLLLFFFAQRYFIEGVTLSGLGGR